MLNKKEIVIMREIYKRTTNNNGMCVIRPVEIMQGIPYNIDIVQEDLAPIMQGLAYDEYFEYTETNVNGEYCFNITLLKKGFAFQRSEEIRLRNRKNSILAKVGITLFGVVLAWVLKYIIQLIINSKGG